MLLLSSSSPVLPAAAAGRRSGSSSTTSATDRAAPLPLSPRLHPTSTLVRASATSHSGYLSKIRPRAAVKSSQRQNLGRGTSDDRSPTMTTRAISSSPSVSAAAAAAASSSASVATPGQTKVAFLGMGIMGVAMVRLESSWNGAKAIERENSFFFIVVVVVLLSPSTLTSSFSSSFLPFFLSSPLFRRPPTSSTPVTRSPSGTARRAPATP
jgi:hypothetical protein